MSGENDADTRDGRKETRDERSDRNWNELLQELRVTQTGTQIISGFLLTLAFQQRFTDLDTFQRNTYLTLVAMAAVSTLLGLAPAIIHRLLFRRHEKTAIVTTGNRILLAVIIIVTVLTAGVVEFLFDVVAGRGAGYVAGALTLLGATALIVNLKTTTAR